MSERTLVPYGPCGMRLCGTPPAADAFAALGSSGFPCDDGSSAAALAEASQSRQASSSSSHMYPIPSANPESFPPKIASAGVAAVTGFNSLSPLEKANLKRGIPKGICLRDLEAFVQENKVWLEETSSGPPWLDVSKRGRKTMYDVAPELIIPKTTCEERIALLSEDDVKRIQTGKVFEQVDQTFVGRPGVVLGGQHLEDLALKSRLCSQTGTVRREYWQAGRKRDAYWMTSKKHSRDKTLPPVPSGLVSGPDFGEEELGSKTELKAGDVVLLRRGVAYVDLLDQGEHSPLSSFASHYWGDETVQMASTLRHHAEQVAPQNPGAACYYICTFSNNQHIVDLGAGDWRRSPFYFGLEHIAKCYTEKCNSAHSLVMLFDKNCSTLTRGWCIFELWICAWFCIPVFLCCEEGLLTRSSQSSMAQMLRDKVAKIDLADAACTVNEEFLMIQKAIETAEGGFDAVFAKLRLVVQDLLSFIGSLAISKDLFTGEELKEVPLTMKISDTHLVTSGDLVSEMLTSACSGRSAQANSRVLLIGQAGSGKTCFSRELIRAAVNRAHASCGGSAGPLPVRVPLAELAKISAMHPGEVANIFAIWAQRTFGADAAALTEASQPLLLVLDGFDEASSERARILSWLRLWLQSEQGAQSTILMTTRSSGLFDALHPGDGSRLETIVKWASTRSLFVERTPTIIETIAFVDGVDGSVLLRPDKPLRVMELAAPEWASIQSVEELASRSTMSRRFPEKAGLEQADGGSSQVVTEWPYSYLEQLNNGNQLLVFEPNSFSPPLHEDEQVEIRSAAWHVPLRLNKLQLHVRMVSDAATFSEVAEQAKVRVSAEEHFVEYLGFANTSIQDLDDEAAAKISGIGVEQLAGIPAEVKSTPLLSSLLAQHMKTIGKDDPAESISKPWFELSVLRSTAHILLQEVADRVKLPYAELRSELAEVFLGLLRKGKRLLGRSDFAGLFQGKGTVLYEEARLGHLRFFEPQRGGQEVQAYHLRLHEFLAAEAWVKEAASLSSMFSEAQANTFLLGAWPYLAMLHWAKDGSASIDLKLSDSTLPDSATLEAVFARLPRIQHLNINLSKTDTTNLEILSCLSKMTALKKLVLNFEGCSSLSDISILSTLQATELQQLELNFKDCRQLEDTNSIWQVLKQCRDLQHLDLIFIGCYNLSSANSMGKVLMQCNDLKHLSLNFCGCSQLSDVTSNSIVLGFMNCKELMYLSLNFSGCRQLPDVTSIGKALKEYKELKHLSLDLSSCSNLSDATANFIGLGLMNCKDLKHLSLDFRRCSTLSDAIMDSIGLGLRNCKELMHLSLEFVCCKHLSDANSIGKALMEFKDLEHLSLNFEGCLKISDATAIGLRLVHCKNLKYLSLNFNRCYALSDATANSIGLGLMHCKELLDLTLNFQACRLLTDATSIGLGIAECKDLKHRSLNFVNCSNLSDATVHSTAQGIINCRDMALEPDGLMDMLSPMNPTCGLSANQLYHDLVDWAPDLHDEGAGERAQPQIIMIDGVRRMVWPEEWGITVKQVVDLLEECRQDPQWDDSFTLGQFVSTFVNPRTRGTGVGYALLVNHLEPKEVVTVVSSAWAGNALEFCQALARSVDLDEPLFIDFLSLYQCEDGAGPTISQQLGSDPLESPWRRVLNQIRNEKMHTEANHGWWRQQAALAWLPWNLAMLSLTCFFAPILYHGCIPMLGFCAHGSCEPVVTWLPLYAWKWTFEPLQSAMLVWVHVGLVLGVCALVSQLIITCLQRWGTIYRGCMVVVPNHNEEMYSRLWSVYDMYVALSLGVPVKLANTLAPVGAANCRNAQMHSDADQRRIEDEIEDYGLEHYGNADMGYQVVDGAIRRVDREAWVQAIITEALWGWPIMLSLTCTVRLLKKGMVEFWEERATAGRIHQDVLEHLTMLASHGRLGFDLFCGNVFAASEAKVWVWGLVLGVLLGQIFVIGRVVYVAKKERGQTTIKTWFVAAVSFLFCEAIIIAALLLGRALGWCALKLYWFNWFILGLAAALSQGSLVFLLIVLVRCCRRGRHRHSPILPRAQSKARNALLALGLLLLLVMMVMTCQLDLWDHYFPTLVFNISLLFGGFLGPLAVVWTSALRWGVVVNYPHYVEWYVRRQDSSENYSDDPNSSLELGLMDVAVQIATKEIEEGQPKGS